MTNQTEISEYTGQKKFCTEKILYNDILGGEEDFTSSTLSCLTVKDLEEAYKVIKVKFL